MKTKQIKVANRPAKKLPCILAASITWLLPLLVLILTTESSFAASAIWVGGIQGFEGDWNFAPFEGPVTTNWNPNNTIPNGPQDTARFGVSNFTNVFLSANTEVNGIVFNPGADAFTITVPSGQATSLTLTISGVGITNNSGVTQNFVSEPGAHGGVINFTNSATAGSNVTITAEGGSPSGVGFNPATVSFQDSSSAGNATLIANGGSQNANLGGRIEFFNTSTAANATLTANGGSGNGLGGGIIFSDSSTAGNATLIANGGSQSGGGIDFFDSSTAGNATLITNGGSQAGGVNGGKIAFNETSSAGNATIINNASAFGGEGFTGFFGSSTAGNATLIANGGSGGGSVGGLIFFQDTSTAGTARVEVFGNGSLDISGHGAPGVTVGSIEGNGDVFLGTNNLTVGSNNLSTIFSGVIQDDEEVGGGSLTKVGTGTLILTGANTYTGPTIVDGGSLLVDGDGSIGPGLTSVNAAGLLGGGGTIRGSVVNGGIVSPGNAVGTLTINNNYTQSGAGTLSIQIAGVGVGQHDLLMVGRTANLAGTLQLVRLNNFQLQPGNQITFLTANGGVNGTFASVQNDFAGSIVGTQITFLANSVVLEATQGSFEELGRTICQTPNDTAVGAALDSAVGDPRAAGLIEFLNSQSLTEICRDLDLISPEQLTSMFSFGVSLANIQTDNLERRMNNVRGGSTGFSATGFSINTRGHDLNLGLAGPSGPEGKSGPSVMQPTPENRWGVFVTGIGEFTDVDSTDNASGFYLSTGGVTFGVDYRLSPNFAIGMMGGYAHTNGDLAQGGSLDVDGGKIGLYATAFSGGFYVNAAATGGLNDYDTHRTALLGTASGDTEGHEFTGLIAGGYDWKTGNLTVGPLASFQYTYVDFDGFTEHGSLAPLTLGDQSADSSRTALGAKASYDWHVGHVLVKPEIRAAWQHEFGDTDYAIVARFANGAGNSFTVNGPAIGRDSLLLGAGVAVLFNDRVSMYAYYDGELARTNYSSNNVTAGLRFTF